MSNSGIEISPIEGDFDIELTDLETEKLEAERRKLREADEPFTEGWYDVRSTGSTYDM